MTNITLDLMVSLCLLQSSEPCVFQCLFYNFFTLFSRKKTIWTYTFIHVLSKHRALEVVSRGRQDFHSFSWNSEGTQTTFHKTINFNL